MFTCQETGEQFCLKPYLRGWWGAGGGLAWAILHQLSSKWQCRLKVLWRWFWFTYNYTYQWLVDKLDNDDIMSVNASEEAGKIPTDELALRKKWSFPLRISSENATKSVGNCEFGHIYWGNPY